MAICNGYPDIAVLPAVGDCCPGAAPYAISKLPKVYPQVLSTENLQESYGYVVDDFNLPEDAWYVYSYALSGSDSTPGDAVESTCSAAPSGAEDSGVYYSYVPTVNNLQGNRDWIVYPLDCQEPSNGITKGPATLILADMSILPSPTVTPAMRVHVDNPWYNVLRASTNNWLTSNPPKGPCSSGKWKLVYKTPGTFPIIEWECEGHEESKSSYPRPSGSAGKDYCSDLDIDLKLIGINSKTTVSDVQRRETWCELQITYTWRGTTDFTGDDLYLYVTSTGTNKICPRVYANFGTNLAGPDTVNWPLQGLGAIAPPGTTFRKRTIYQPVYLFALPCESPKEQQGYAPCCEDKGANGVGDTEVVFYASTDNCAITKSVTLTVACDDIEEEEEEPQGQFVADLLFRDSEETISLIQIGECGEPITESRSVYLCAQLIVTGGKYCSCDESVPIQLSGSGVVVDGPGSFIIPKGVYDTNTVIPLSVPITIRGNGKSCNGTVTATAFGITAELEVNGEDCNCDEPSDLNFDIRGSKYIKVERNVDSDGKVIYTILIDEKQLIECDPEEQPDEEDETDVEEHNEQDEG